MPYLLLLLCSLAIADDLDPGLVARIGDHPITAEDFALYLEQEYGGDEIGQEALEFLLDEALVLAEAEKRSVGLTDAEVRKQIRAFDEQIRAAGSTLNRYLQDQGVDPADFEKSVRHHVLHSKMARKDLGLAEGKPVSEAKLRLWLKQIRAQMNVEIEEIGGNVRARIGSKTIRRLDVGKAIVKKLPPDTLHKSLTELIGITLIEKRAREHALTLETDDLRKEIDNRETLLARRHNIEGVTLESFLSARGMTIARLKETRRFRAESSLGKMIDLQHDRNSLQTVYQENRDAFDERYGKRYDVSTIFLNAVTRPNQFSSRTFEMAETRLKKVRTEFEQGTPFKNLAYIHSEHSSAKKGGRLGILSASDKEHVPLIEACEGLKVGEIAGPVRTQSGCHLIMLEKEPAKPTFENLRLEVRQFVRQKLYRSLFDEARESIQRKF